MIHRKSRPYGRRNKSFTSGQQELLAYHGKDDRQAFTSLRPVDEDSWFCTNQDDDHDEDDEDDDDDEDHGEDSQDRLSPLAPIYVRARFVDDMDNDSVSVVSGLTSVNSAITCEEDKEVIRTFMMNNPAAAAAAAAANNDSVSSTDTDTAMASVSSTAEVGNIQQRAAERAEYMARKMQQIIRSYQARSSEYSAVLRDPAHDFYRGVHSNINAAALAAATACCSFSPFDVMPDSGGLQHDETTDCYDYTKLSRASSMRLRGVSRVSLYREKSRRLRRKRRRFVFAIMLSTLLALLGSYYISKNIQAAKTSLLNKMNRLYYKAEAGWWFLGRANDDTRGTEALAETKERSADLVADTTKKEMVPFWLLLLEQEGQCSLLEKDTCDFDLDETQNTYTEMAGAGAGAALVLADFTTTSNDLPWQCNLPLSRFIHERCRRRLHAGTHTHSAKGPSSSIPRWRF